MEQQLLLHIILTQPPPGVDFGLQKGKGSSYETIQKQRSGKGDLYFEAVVKTKPGKDNMPDFSGPLVQGPIGERFIYIDIGTYAGQADSIWGRRLKIPLTGITTSVLQQLRTIPGMTLETKIDGTAKDGGPNCGTVKPFDGWKPKHSH